jgi:hypothetical protein
MPLVAKHTVPTKSKKAKSETNAPSCLDTFILLMAIVATLGSVAMLLATGTGVPFALAQVTPNICVDPDNTMVFVQDVYTISNCSISVPLAVNVSLCTTSRFLNLTTCPPNGDTLMFPVWPDADGDGQGSKTANATFVCSFNSSYVRNNLDCNDADPTIFQGSFVRMPLDTSDLATLWPPAFNFSSAIGQICTGLSAQSWATAISASGDLMFSSASCAGYGMAWHYDVAGDFWVPEVDFVFSSLSAGTRFYGHSSGLSSDFVIISQEEETPGFTVNAFEIWQRNGVSSWTRLTVNTTVLTSTPSLLNPPQVSMAKTPGGITVVAAGSTALPSGTSTVELAYMNGSSYVRTTLCGTCVSGCPINWNAYTAGIDYCTAIGFGTIGVLVAVDQQDGLRAVVADAANRLYFFGFSETTKLWTFLTATPFSGIGGIDSFNWTYTPVPSLAMYNGLTAFGVPGLEPTSPAVGVDGVNCTGFHVGYVRYLTWNGVATWTLGTYQLISPSACTGDNCGFAVAVEKGNKIVAGCPQTEAPSGKSFGYAVEWYVTSGVNYPQQTALWEAPFAQRGTGVRSGVANLSDVNFGMSVAASSSGTLAFGSPQPLVNGLTANSNIGRVWVARIANVTNCWG